MTLGEKASYVKGLVDGLELDMDKKENKMILAIVDLLEDMAESVSELENRVDDATDQVEDINDEIDGINDQICRCKDSEQKHGCDCDCGCEGSDEDWFYEVTCPSCNTTVCLSEGSLMKNNINCPDCGQEIEIDLGDQSSSEDENSDDKDFGDND